MVFQTIGIDQPSPRVLGKLRKGSKVRILNGSGLSLIVHAERFNPITKSFNKGKAYTIALTPAEIEANINPPAEMGEMAGKGLFTKASVGLVKAGKKMGKTLKPVGVAVGKEVLPVGKAIAKEGVKEMAKYAPVVGAQLGSSALTGLALMAGQPELVPVAQTVGSKLGKAGGKAVGDAVSKKANQEIDSYDPFNQQAPSRNAPPSRRPDATQYQQIVNTASSPVGRANMSQYLQSLTNEEIELELARRRGGGYGTAFDRSGGKQVLAQYTEPVGQGLYASGRGSGLHSRVKGFKEKASVGVHGNLLGYGLPPALQSQANSSNFVMASRMPPAYASLIKQGGGLYA